MGTFSGIVARGWDGGKERQSRRETVGAQQEGRDGERTWRWQYEDCASPTEGGSYQQGLHNSQPWLHPYRNCAPFVVCLHSVRTISPCESSAFPRMRFTSKLPRLQRGYQSLRALLSARADALQNGRADVTLKRNAGNIKSARLRIPASGTEELSALVYTRNPSEFISQQVSL